METLKVYVHKKQMYRDPGGQLRAGVFDFEPTEDRHEYLVYELKIPAYLVPEPMGKVEGEELADKEPDHEQTD